jgi:protein SERAC1
VSGESATVGDARENRATIHADHSDMAKFSTEDDPGYKNVLHAIETLLESLTESELALANQSR